MRTQGHDMLVAERRVDDQKVDLPALHLPHRPREILGHHEGEIAVKRGVLFGHGRRHRRFFGAQIHPHADRLKPQLVGRLTQGQKTGRIAHPQLHDPVRSDGLHQPEQEGDMPQTARPRDVARLPEHRPAGQRQGDIVGDGHRARGGKRHDRRCRGQGGSLDRVEGHDLARLCRLFPRRLCLQGFCRRGLARLAFLAADGGGFAVTLGGHRPVFPDCRRRCGSARSCPSG